MKKIDIEYLKFMWTCNKVCYPNKSFWFHLRFLIQVLFEDKAGKSKIERIDDLEGYMKNKK